MRGNRLPESAAARILAWYRASVSTDAASPVSLDDLAASLGLAITTFSSLLYPDTLGFVQPGEDLIFLSAEMSANMRRFTLAHELGHVALHRRTGRAAEIAQAGAGADQDFELSTCDGSDLDMLSSDDIETLGAGQVYSARARREGEANAFAAALLLPANETLATYSALCDADTPRPALALAREFGVSEEVALRRLTALLMRSDDKEAAPEAAPQSTATLDGDQRRAARAEAPALITAGPGSGKTSALLARFRYLTEECGVAPKRILTVTYSRKAAEQLRARLGALVGERADAPTVSTIHAFCGDVLRQYGPQVGLRPDYRLISGVEGYLLLRRIVNRAPLVHYTPQARPTQYFRGLLDAISRAKDEMITPEEYRAAADRAAANATTDDEREEAARHLEVATVYASYQEALRERGDADFSDLINAVTRLLQTAPEASEELRERYDYFLVDEFQDVNYAIGALLRALVGRTGALWAVGDVDQAIYRFRGASPANLLRFTKDYDGAQVIPLGHNYRSQPQILRAASAFATAYLPDEQRLAQQPSRVDASEQPAVFLATATDGAAELDGLARLIRERAATGTPLRAQAVLVRTRAQIKQVSDGLLARGVQARVLTPLFGQPCIKTLLAVVSLTTDPLARGLLRAGAMPDHPFSEADAAAVLHAARQTCVSPMDVARMGETQPPLSAASEAGLRRLAHIVSELRSAPTVTVGLSRYVFSLTLLGRRLLGGDADGEAGSVARLLEICRAFDDQRASQTLDGDEQPPLMADWEGLLDYVQALLAVGQDSSESATDDTNDNVLVMTAHAAKGLEFSAVYLPQLVNRKFPLIVGGRDRIAPPPGLLREDEANEEANLFYVALTRARDTLTLSYAPRYGKGRYTPSPYLEPIKKALGDHLTQMQWARPPEDGEATTATAELPPEQPNRGQNITVSQLEAYEWCPQSYAYQYVYELRPPQPAPLSLRVAVQQTVADLRARFAAGAEPTLEEARALYEMRWSAARAQAAAEQQSAESTEERDETLAPVYRSHGERSIETHWSKLTTERTGESAQSAIPDAGAPVQTSVEFEGATLTGTLDHVAPDGGIVQYVSRSNLKKETPRLRDLFYLLAAEQTASGAHPTPISKVSLSSGERAALSLDDKKRGALVADVAATLDGLLHERYTPQPEERKCQTCPFWYICPA